MPMAKTTPLSGSGTSVGAQWPDGQDLTLLDWGEDASDEGVWGEGT